MPAPIPLISAAPAVTTDLDVTLVLGDLWPLLNASSESDAVFWTEAELYQWADEATQELARLVGIFVERDTTISTANGARSYTLPTRHISSIHVALGNKPLEPASIPELEARDDTWKTGASAAANADVKRWYGDGDGVEKIGLYKVPSAIATLAVIHHQFLATIDSGNPTLSAPSPLRDYLLWAVLAEARRKESDSTMPEVAAHADERVKLLRTVFQAYWGVSQ